MRSLIEPPGLWCSSLRNSRQRPASIRVTSTRGVLPMRPRRVIQEMLLYVRPATTAWRCFPPARASERCVNYLILRGGIHPILLQCSAWGCRPTGRIPNIPSSVGGVLGDVLETGGTLLGSISDFCRRTGMAESTFGRRAVNDGKFVARLRDGGRVTPETLNRVNQFIAKHGFTGSGDSPPELLPLIRAGAAAPAPVTRELAPEKNFRFFDNRQKYLLFVNTCSEKDVVARRVGLELGHIHPRPPAVRLFDAGMGDGTVLARVMREMHRRFPTVPFYIVGKEISLEDVRLSLRKMADRFFEHPATVLVVTNMYYTEAPWLTPRAVPAATSMVWHEAVLTGTTSHDFSEQIAALEPFLAKNWQAGLSPKTGNPVYEHPTVLVLYRDDYRFLLDDVIPRRGAGQAEYDMAIAPPPYRARPPPRVQ